jgi:ATP phosphoribosyltransferase
MSTERLRIAVQRSGRLADPSMALLRRAGLAFRVNKDRLFLVGENMPVDVLLVRDDDIPGLLVDGSCDIGIVGRNVLDEASLSTWQAESPLELLELGFGACRLAVAVPETSRWKSIADLEGARIATSYPGLLSQWLERSGVSARIVVLNGSVEIAPRLGKADAICDLVSTGATLSANHLRELVTVYASEAVLAAGPATRGATNAGLVDSLCARIRGAQSGEGMRLLMLQAPRKALPAITRLLSSHERPSVMSLDGRPDDIAMQALCNAALDWQHLEELKRLGAHGLMLLSVERMLA